MKLAALALLLAQLSGGPFDRLPIDPGAAVAVAPQGMLVAWSEIQPGRPYAVMQVGLIDFDGNWISPVRTLAPRNNLHASSPAIATDGERFFVAWVDRKGSSFQPVSVSGALVGPNGEQISETFDLSDAVTGSPSIVWDGLFFSSYGALSFTITPFGAIQRTASAAVAGRVPFATPEANGWVDWRDVPSRTVCIPVGMWLPCGPSPVNYGLDWAIVSERGIHTGGVAEGFYNAGKPAILASGDDLLIIWSDTKSLKALPIIDGRMGPFFRSEESGVAVEPSAAEKLVVFESGGDIWGVPIVDGRQFGKLFRISRAKERETAPRVYLVGPNRYLVTWVVNRDRLGTRLAGQFVTIE
jgi:hypothetical protein